MRLVYCHYNKKGIFFGNKLKLLYLASVESSHER